MSEIYGILIGTVMVGAIVCWIGTVMHVTQFLVTKWKEGNHDKIAH